MRPFAYHRAPDAASAVRLAARSTTEPPTRAPAQFLAGGTNIVDYMRLGVTEPEVLVDLNGLAAQHGRIEAGPQGLRLGALARMAEVADHPAVRSDYPMIADALVLAASPQIRNMGAIGGNVLQRTRCEYFRDVGWKACNKRAPGSGCAAIGGVNRKHAVLGVSDHCIAAYAGDLGQALVALGATVEILGLHGPRRLLFEALHLPPGDTPHIETVLRPGELITGFVVPAGPWTRRSLYLKIRDRQSFEFALASAAVALDLDGETVREARIALGGVSSRPWRAKEAEAALKGQTLTPDTAKEAARAAFASAVTHGANEFKPELGRRTLVRALMQAKAMEA
jgi:xanthine dehydrogenase YagS FAD-binding subunit